MSKTNEIATRTESVELTNPNDIMEFANNLKQLIVQNKLFTDIKGKNYVNVEGWQIAGAFTGVFPIVEEVTNLSQDDFYKYRAEVTLRDKENRVVGSGVAICTNREFGKKNFDEFAVASMAQTRAVGKAFRMKIGWLLKVAGYETTPAEEMESMAEEANVVNPASNNEIKVDHSVGNEIKAKASLYAAKNLDELKQKWQELAPEFRNKPDFISVKERQKAKFEEARD